MQILFKLIFFVLFCTLLMDMESKADKNVDNWWCELSEEADQSNFHVDVAFRFRKFIGIIGRWVNRATKSGQSGRKVVIRSLIWWPGKFRGNLCFDAKFWEDLSEIDGLKPIKYAFTTTAKGNMEDIIIGQKERELVYLVQVLLHLMELFNHYIFLGHKSDDCLSVRPNEYCEDGRKNL